MSPNSSMKALQCISTAGEFGGFKENSDGISHPLTRQTSLIAATSPSYTLWPSRHPIVLSSPVSYKNRSPPDPPHTLKIVCNADALTLPKSFPVRYKSRKTSGMCAFTQCPRRSVTHMPHPTIGHPIPKELPDVIEALRDSSSPPDSPCVDTP
jgi:hypothetical protein